MTRTVPKILAVLPGPSLSAINDYPDRLREVMRERGLPLPQGPQR